MSVRKEVGRRFHEAGLDADRRRPPLDVAGPIVAFERAGGRRRPRAVVSKTKTWRSGAAVLAPCLSRSGGIRARQFAQRIVHCAGASGRVHQSAEIIRSERLR